MDPNDKCLTEREAAEFLRVSVHALRKWRRRREGPPFLKLGSRRVVYLKSHLTAFLEGSRVPTTPAVSASLLRRHGGAA